MQPHTKHVHLYKENEIVPDQHIPYRTCKCNPKPFSICVECVDLKVPNKDCWMCEGHGMVEIESWEANDESPVIWVHNK